MYKPVKPIRCPSCGEIVQVDTSMILTSNPPQYKWECPKCGRTGTTSSKDIIAFENQKPMRTSGYIQKIDEPDLGVGVTTTNATGDGYNTINAVTAHKTTECNIPAPQFIQQGWECPKCGAVLAPHQHYCPFCSKKENDWITTVGTGTQPFYSERTQKDNLTPQTGQYTNPNTNNNNTAPSAIPDYRPFCSPSEYDRTNWIGTNTPSSGQYTNPNTSTTISKVTQ